MNKFKKLIAVWLNLEPEIQTEIMIKKRTVIKNAPEWTQNHAKWLANTLKEPAGSDLMANMDSTEVQVNAWAVASLNGTQDSREFRAGIASGVSMAFNKLRRMSDVKPEQESEEATDEDLENILRERMNGH